MGPVDHLKTMRGTDRENVPSLPTDVDLSPNLPSARSSPRDHGGNASTPQTTTLERTTMTGVTSSVHFTEITSTPSTEITSVHSDTSLRSSGVPSRMRNEVDRLATFVNWPSGASVRPRDLTRAGFFYMGKEDRVQCAFCDLGLKDWVEGDQPMQEHRRHISTCPFVLGLEVGNIPVEEPSTALPLAVSESQRHAVRGSTTGSESTRAGITMRILTARPRHVSFATEKARFRTFVNWSPSRIPRPETLARAGFFYVGLRHWEPQDDPWTEHARWFPQCGFVRQCKGDAYIQMAKEKNSPNNQPTQTQAQTQRPQEPIPTGGRESVESTSGKQDVLDNGNSSKPPQHVSVEDKKLFYECLYEDKPRLTTISSNSDIYNKLMGFFERAKFGDTAFDKGNIPFIIEQIKAYPLYLDEYVYRKANGPPFQRGEQFRYEAVRLLSFYEMEASFAVPVIRLARAGFYSSRQGTEVICFSCGRRLREWARGDDPVVRHRYFFPDCPFVRGADTENVPIIPTNDGVFNSSIEANNDPFPNLANARSTTRNNGDNAYLMLSSQQALSRSLGIRSPEVATPQITAFERGTIADPPSPYEDWESRDQELDGVVSNVCLSDDVSSFENFTHTGPSTPNNTPSMLPSQQALSRSLGISSPESATPQTSPLESSTVAHAEDASDVPSNGNTPAPSPQEEWDLLEREPDGDVSNGCLGDDACNYVDDEYALLSGLKAMFRSLNNMSSILSSQQAPSRPLGISSPEDATPQTTPLESSTVAHSGVGSGISSNENTSGPPPQEDWELIDWKREANALKEENKRLKKERTCKICEDEEVSMVFLPCGHLVACVHCAPALRVCFVCRAPIKSTVRSILGYM